MSRMKQHESRWAAIVSISSKIGCAPQTLNEWVKKVEIDTGQRGGISTEQAEKMKALEREVRELKQANEILRKVPAYFAPALIAASGDCRAVGRSSTAHSNDDLVHRGSPRGSWPSGWPHSYPVGIFNETMVSHWLLPERLCYDGKYV